MGTNAPPAAIEELELMQSHMAQKPVLRGEVGCGIARQAITTTKNHNFPRGGATPPPRRAQPLLLLSRSNPPH